MFDMADVVYPVIDACETGIRYQLGTLRPEVGSAVAGTVRFRRGARVQIEGVVVRVVNGYAAVRLNPPGIPFKIIFDEQRYLLRHYPTDIRRPPAGPTALS